MKHLRLAVDETGNRCQACMKDDLSPCICVIACGSFRCVGYRGDER